MSFPEIPGYRIERILGQGGMATVYLAVQDMFERHVALKVMAEHLVKDPSFAQRFLREARLVAKMSHQNIVPVFDVGAYGSYHYMAMEYLPGGDLKKKMRSGLPLSESIRIVQAIARGLNYAGSKNLVHRDIKPENILFREDGSPVISDFGIARQADSKTNMTMTGAVIGTPHYMSPEQAEGVEVDPRSDLYSLGIIVYEMLTGHVPFQGDSAVTIGIKHITEDPPPLPPNVAMFQEFIDIALAKHPDDRYQTGDEMAEDLGIILDSMTDAEATVVISRDEIRRSSRGGESRAARTSANRSRVSRIKTPRGTTGHPPGNGRLWLGLGVAALGVAGVTAVLVLDPFSDKPANRFPVLSPPVVNQSKEAGQVFEAKAAQLVESANQALAEGRLYEPEQDNAQYFLTTLLALVPDSPEGREGIRKLFNLYLEQAEASLTKNDLAQSGKLLGQASQISFYIRDEALQQRFGELYQRLNAQKQQSLLSEERNKRLTALLARADEALKQDNLTAPAANNAYDLYQQVLVEDPENEAAKAGITRIAERFMEKAREKASEKAFGLAKAFIAAAIQIAPDHPDIETVRAEIAKAEEDEANRLMSQDNKKLAELEKARKLREQEIKKRQTQIANYLASAEAAMKAGKLLKPVGDNALEFYENVLLLEPANVQALQGKEKVGQALIALGNAAVDEERFDEARALFAQARKVVSSVVEVSRAENRLAEAEQQARWTHLIEQGNKALAENRLSAPPGDNALEYFDQVLREDPNNLKALQGRERVGMAYLDLARMEIEKNDFAEAENFLAKARKISQSTVEIATVERLLADRKEAFVRNEALARAEDALAAGRLTKPRGQSALDYYQQILSVDPGNRAALEGIKKIEQKYQEFIRNDLAESHFDEAESYLESWASFSKDQAALNRFAEMIRQARAEQARAQQVVTEKPKPVSKPVTPPKKETASPPAVVETEAFRKALDKANRLIAEPYKKPGLFGSNDKARRRLVEAYESIDAARKMSPGHPRIGEALEKLDRKYGEIIQLLMDSDDLSEAEKFISDTREFDWTGQRVALLAKKAEEQKASGQKKLPRAIGAF